MRIILLFWIQETKLTIREVTYHKQCHYNSSSSKKLDYDEVVVYDKDEISSVSSAEKISKNNSIKVLYLEGGIQSD